jgi:hypothetical protein
MSRSNGLGISLESSDARQSSQWNLSFFFLMYEYPAKKASHAEEMFSTGRVI